MKQTDDPQPGADHDQPTREPALSTRPHSSSGHAAAPSVTVMPSMRASGREHSSLGGGGGLGAISEMEGVDSSGGGPSARRI